jgi:hypothetical protein
MICPRYPDAAKVEITLIRADMLGFAKLDPVVKDAAHQKCVSGQGITIDPPIKEKGRSHATPFKYL